MNIGPEKGKEAYHGQVTAQHCIELVYTRAQSHLNVAADPSIYPSIPLSIIATCTYWVRRRGTLPARELRGPPRLPTREGDHVSRLGHGGGTASGRAVLSSRIGAGA